MPNMTLGTVRCEAGQKANGLIEVTNRVDGTPLGFPVMVVCGQSDGPVFLLDASIHGDEHEFQVTRFLNTKFQPIPKVLRLEVMGETHLHAVRVLVDPDSPSVFGFFPLLVPENGAF